MFDVGGTEETKFATSVVGIFKPCGKDAPTMYDRMPATNQILCWWAAVIQLNTNKCRKTSIVLSLLEAAHPFLILRF